MHGRSKTTNHPYRIKIILGRMIQEIILQPDNFSLFVCITKCVEVPQARTGYNTLLSADSSVKDLSGHGSIPGISRRLTHVWENKNQAQEVYKVGLVFLDPQLPRTTLYCRT